MGNERKKNYVIFVLQYIAMMRRKIISQNNSTDMLAVDHGRQS